MYDLIYNNLMTNGYHLGKISEMFNDLTGIKEEDYLKYAEAIRSTADKKDLRYRYRHSYVGQNDPNLYIKDGYSGPYPTEEEFLPEISMNQIERRKKFVEDVIKSGADSRTTQQWSLLNFQKFPEDNFDMEELIFFYKNLFRQHTALIYPELMAKKDSFSTSIQISLYEDGDFSEVHFDGINPGRACVIIIYLSDPEEYNEGGGELFIGHNLKKVGPMNVFEDPYEKVIPIYGNYAIMDFTKFNVGHSIEMVKNGFKRFAVQSFIGP